MEKVFVLTAHYEDENNVSTSNVIDVYNKRESAQKVMEREYEIAIKQMKEEKELTEEDMQTEIFNGYASIFNLENNVDYIKFEICEKVVKE